MDASDAPVPVPAATMPSGATVIGGVQVLPVRLPALPPSLEAVGLGVTHSLVALPVLYAVATPALEIMARYWVALVHDLGLGMAQLFVTVSYSRWWRYGYGMSYTTVRLLVFLAIMAAAVHVLTLPLQVGARQRARTQRGTLPLYALSGGVGLALAVWWVELAPLMVSRSYQVFLVIPLIGLMAAGRVALAGRRARLGASEVRELGRELAVAGATLVGLVAAVALVVGGERVGRTLDGLGLAMVSLPGLAAFALVVLRPLRELVLSAGSARRGLPASPPAALGARAGSAGPST